MTAKTADGHVKGVPPVKASLAFLIVDLEVDGQTDRYVVAPISADFGPAFRVDKVVAEGKKKDGPYDVSLSGHGNCDCKGFSFRGSCRHYRGLLMLWAAGELPVLHHPRSKAKEG
jgi:hypothetical protein